MPRMIEYTDDALQRLQAEEKRADEARRKAERKAAQIRRDVLRVQQAREDQHRRALGQLLIDAELHTLPLDTLREALPWLAFVLRTPTTWQRFVAFFRDLTPDELSEWVAEVLPANEPEKA